MNTKYDLNQDLPTFAIIWRDVAEDVHLIVGQFGTVQFFNEPLQLIARIDRIVEGPRIKSSAVVGI